jgi:aryl-alcohol dehydrogenase-like predicted oxidoreductase
MAARKAIEAGRRKKRRRSAQDLRARGPFHPTIVFELPVGIQSDRASSHRSRTRGSIGAVTMLPVRALGGSGIEVSVLALGSWRTYERIAHDDGLAVMRAARDAGITFLDDARYDDETGRAPIRTGYSEVVFGELFRATGWKRDEVVVANKLWWEFWPEQSASQEVDKSLQRMGFDYLDLIYSFVAPDGPGVEEIVAAMGALIAEGKVREWGTCNWEPSDHAEAARVAIQQGVPPPCASQLPYSLTLRSYVEDSAARDALEVSGAAVVASFVLFGGALTGKYLSGPPESGRWTGELHDPDLADALRAATHVRQLAERLDTTSAALALAFALANDRVASVLFGATNALQVTENVRAVELLDRLEAVDLAELRAIGLPASK